MQVTCRPAERCRAQRGDADATLFTQMPARRVA